MAATDEPDGLRRAATCAAPRRSAATEHIVTNGTGKPCIKGRRIWVSLVLDFLAGGMSLEEVMEEYGLDRDDVLASIAYGAEMSRERYADTPVEAGP